MSRGGKCISYIKREIPARVRESRWKEHVGGLGILKGDSVVRRENSLGVPGKDAHVKKVRIRLGDVDAKHRTVGVADIQ